MIFIVGIGIIVIATLYAMVTVERARVGLAFFCGTIAAALFTLVCSVTIVDAGTVKVKKYLGAMQPGHLSEGFHFINPVLSLNAVNTRRQSLEFTGDNTAKGPSSDRISLIVDITVPYVTMPGPAWKIVQRYGTEGWNLITPNARGAIRDCTTRKEWAYNMSAEGRQELVGCISERLPVLVERDLIAAGLDPDLAREAFVFPPAILREVRPVRESLLQSIAEKESAKEDLKRQKTLTQIAKEEANRRENEGLGIQKMMAQLPTEYGIPEMVAIIHANAAKMHAEAFMKAVEKGNPNISVVVDGSGETAVATNALPQSGNIAAEPQGQ